MTPSLLGVNRTTLRDAAAIARTELWAQYRHVRADTRRTLGMALSIGLFAVLFPGFLLPGAIGFGDRLAAGTVPLGTAGAACGGLAVVAGYIGGAGGFNQRRVGDVGPLIRTSTPPLAVSLSRMLDRLVQSLLLLVPAGLVMLAGVAVGAGGPAVPLVVALWALPVLAAGLFVGRIVGDCFRYANQYFALSLWLKALLVGTVMIVGYAGTTVVLTAQFGTTGQFGRVALPAFLPGRPLHAYAGVAFVPFGGTPSALGAGIGLALVASVPLAVAVALRIETRLLVTVVGGEETEAPVTRGVPRVFAARPSLRVAWRHLLRTRRDPRMLAHLTPLLFGGLAMLASIVQNPDSLWTLGPIALYVAGITLSGAAYCLNPLGDERDQLSLLLTSTPSTGVLLRGRAVAGVALGVVPSVLAAGPLAVVGFSPLFAVGQSLLAVALSFVACGVALGVGAVVPKFERREAMGIERSHPSNIAVFGVFFGGLVVGLTAIVLLWLAVTGRRPGLALAGVGGVLAVTGAVAAGGYVYAVRRFDALMLDDA